MKQDCYQIVKDRAAAYLKNYDPAFVTEYMSSRCAGEKEAAIAQADQLLEQRFTFTDKWDMEPCETPYTLREMTWDYSPNGDPEWIFMLNRHEYLHKLLLAFRFTGDSRYIVKLKWYLDHWISANPILPEATAATRSIDTGIRCMSWQFLLLHLMGGGLMSQEEAGRILKCISSQYEYMRNGYAPKYTLSNWGLLQTTAICQGYLWFREYLPGNGLEDWAWQELKTQLELQVMPDGSHWEQSFMYHIEVLLACMKLLASRKEYLPEGTGWLLKKVELMSRYVMYGAGPDHNQIAQCDSDVTDVRDVLVKAAVLTGDRQCRFGGFDDMDMDSAWLMGRDGICAYGEMKPDVPQERSLHAQDTGNIYIRSSWFRDSHFTYLTCGPLGSSHGHADLTHISLYYEGKPFLTDSGRYSYREEEALRPALKSAQAHNVCVIDGESHGLPRGAWGFDTYGECLKNYLREEGPVHYCEMSYHGTLSDNQNYLVIRRVLMADCGIWLIVNDIECRGTHGAKEYYHLAPEVEPRRGNHAEGISGDKSWVLASGGSRLQLLGSGDFRKEPCVISKTYNQLSESACLIKESHFQDRLTDWTCLGGEGIHMDSVPVYQCGSSSPAPESQVVSRSFTTPWGESWVFLVWNRETCKGNKLYFCNGVPVYGKAAAIRCRNGNTTLYRLRN